MLQRKMEESDDYENYKPTMVGEAFLERVLGGGYIWGKGGVKLWRNKMSFSRKENIKWEDPKAWTV